MSQPRASYTMLPKDGSDTRWTTAGQPHIQQAPHPAGLTSSLRAGWARGLQPVDDLYAFSVSQASTSVSSDVSVVGRGYRIRLS